MSPPVVHLEVHKSPCGTLRISDEQDFRFGDDYRLAATAELVSDKLVKIHGVDKVPTTAEYRAIARFFAAKGYLKCQILRNGRWKTFNLSRFK